MKKLREALPFSEKILQALHNLCATAPELARKSEEFAQIYKVDKGEIEKLLDDYSVEGYVQSFLDDEGKKRYCLTPRGIIKVSALFT